MNADEINDEIVKLQNAETTWTNIQRLSWLYTVRDHMTDTGAAVQPVEVMPDYAGEFGVAVSGKPIGKLIDILSEHMALVKILHPKEYDAVISRISETR